MKGQVQTLRRPSRASKPSLAFVCSAQSLGWGWRWEEGVEWESNTADPGLSEGGGLLPWDTQKQPPKATLVQTASPWTLIKNAVLLGISCDSLNNSQVRLPNLAKVCPKHCMGHSEKWNICWHSISFVVHLKFKFNRCSVFYLTILSQSKYHWCCSCFTWFCLLGFLKFIFTCFYKLSDE